MKIRLSTLAICDLQDISDYTVERWGEEKEIEYINGISARLDEISEGEGQVRSRNDLFKGCKASPVGRHLIIFMKNDEVVFVSRILHQSMDFPRHIFPSS